MGGRGRSRTQRKHFRQSRENVWKRSKSDDTSTNPTDDDNNTNNNKSKWQPFATQNPSFDEYYKEQAIVGEEEWDTFIEYLRKPLPAAFRINSSSQFYTDIRSQLENDFSISLRAEIADESEAEAIRPLPWYPENLAWQSNFSRMQLRKNQALERFHEFLKLGNEIGNITRQEAVSMVPPLFLDVCPDHFVLDMCAAPGSKTFQLLEMIYQSLEPGCLPRGMVVANDVDVQRCNLLIHQTKRMCTANLLVTNHEAQHFPSCHLSRNCANGSPKTTEKELVMNQLLFDRVLCDVPCSGDGTLRKAPDIWRKWNAGMGNGLHGLQLQIAIRGLSLLKVGGRMVYSTCSMNPIENEAVVAEILRRCGDSVELVDVSNELPQLVRRPGLKRWKVRDKGMWFASYKDVPESRRGGVVPGMFPCGNFCVDTSVTDAGNEKVSGNECNGNCESEFEAEDGVTLSDVVEEVSTLPLERCMRIVPHDQNTGSFFIAVFRKLSSLPALQKKAVSQPSKSSFSNVIQDQTSPSEMNEEMSGVKDNVADGTDDQPTDETSYADLRDNGIDGAALDSELSKISEENVAQENQASSNKGTGSESNRGKRKLQIQGKWRGVDPVIFYKEDAVVSKIKEFYGIKESFPFDGHLITRNSDTNHVKRIYYVSKSVKDVLELNLLGGQQLKIASVGLKMFERQTSKDGTSSPCMFRISSEGLPLLLPYITKQILYASPIDFKHLLQYKSIKFADFVDAEFGEKASKLLLGCCVVVLNKDGPSSNPPPLDASTVAIGCWRGRTNVSVMVTAMDCQELLERLSIPMEIKTHIPPATDVSSVVAEAAKINGDSKEDAEIATMETIG